MIPVYTALIAGLLAVQTTWIITDSRTIKARLKSYKDIRLFIVYGIPALQWVSHFFFPLPLTAIIVALMPVGLLLFASGVILCMWARFTMRDSWGVPAQHDISRQKNLVTAGPFRFSRNPIYVGLVLLTFGLALALRSSLFFLTYLVYFFFDIAIKKEEELLKKHFGKAYLDYAARVPRYL